MSDDNERSLQLLLAVALLAIIVGGTIDLVLDAPERILSPHAIYEIAMILGALVTTVVLGRRWLQAERSLVETHLVLDERSSERDAWRARAQSALGGLGRAVEAQFQSWSLTPSESEVALLLLKGRSHKSIARASGRSERTVRQHAVAVYQKSGLGGRAELAAFFLEDLMLPDGVREVLPANGGERPAPATRPPDATRS